MPLDDVDHRLGGVAVADGVAARRELGEVRREDAVLGELEPEALVVAPGPLDQLDVVEVVRHEPTHRRVLAVELVPRSDLRSLHVVVDEHLVRDLQFEIFGPLAHALLLGSPTVGARIAGWTNH